MLKSQPTSFAPTINSYHNLRERLETLTSSTPTNNHCYDLKERLEILISSAPNNNYYRGLREGLEIQLVSTTFTSFVSSSNIPNIISSSIEPAKTGNTFWHRQCWRSWIKDSIPAAHSLCEYIWKVILYIVLTSKACLNPDI